MKLNKTFNLKLGKKLYTGLSTIKFTYVSLSVSCKKKITMSLLNILYTDKQCLFFFYFSSTTDIVYPLDKKDVAGGERCCKGTITLFSTPLESF